MRFRAFLSIIELSGTFNKTLIDWSDLSIFLQHIVKIFLYISLRLVPLAASLSVTHFFEAVKAAFDKFIQ